MEPHFSDRFDAARALVPKLQKLPLEGAIIYALPRGGVETGAELAKILHLPLSLVVTRKIGHPVSAEYAVGAVSEHAEPVLNERETSRLNQDWLNDAIERERAEIMRRSKAYLPGGKPLPAKGRTAIIVDDGVATGYTMLAAIRELRLQKPSRIIAAAPVIEAETAARLRKAADQVVAVSVTANFLGSVGQYYDRFEQVSDEEVKLLLRHAIPS